MRKDLAKKMFGRATFLAKALWSSRDSVISSKKAQHRGFPAASNSEMELKLVFVTQSQKFRFDFVSLLKKLNQGGLRSAGV